MSEPQIDVQQMIAKAKAAGMKPAQINGVECYAMFGGGQEPITDGSFEVNHPTYGKGRAYPVEATA